jgi:hypothetical protein
MDPTRPDEPNEEGIASWKFWLAFFFLIWWLFVTLITQIGIHQM